MKIQLVSDLHLEYLEDEGDDIDFGLIICPSAPTLIMAGDVATYNCPILPAFLAWVAKKFDYVFWVLGNHEFYNTKGVTMIEVKARLRSMCPLNLHILDNEFVTVDDVIIIGSTMWSEIPLQHSSKIVTTTSDYRYIYSNTGTGTICVDEVNSMHNESVAFIREVLKQHKGKYSVVVTHHAPSMHDTIHPMYHGSPLNHAFASEVAFEEGHAPDVWCFGHTHFNVNISNHRNGYKMVTNQFGYEGEHEGLLYKFGFCIDVGSGPHYG